MCVRTGYFLVANIRIKINAVRPIDDRTRSSNIDSFTIK